MCVALSPSAGASLRPISAATSPPVDDAAITATCAFDVHTIASENLTGDVNAIRVAVRPAVGSNGNTERATQRIRIAPQAPAAFALVKVTESAIEIMVLDPSGVSVGELSGDAAYALFRSNSQRMRVKLTRAPEARSQAGEACLDLSRYRTAGVFDLLPDESCADATQIRLRRMMGPHAASRASAFALITLQQNEFLVTLGGPLWRRNNWIEAGELGSAGRISESSQIYFDRIERMIAQLRGCVRRHREALGMDVRFRGEYENAAKRLQLQLQLDHVRPTP